MKKLLFSQRSDTPHWVGDGFPVRSMFNYNEHAQAFSPFLLMDYGGPAEFPPTERVLGVGEHPHRGFETVTIVYSGEVEHRDSAGGGGLIRPGGVQWMTAGSGLVHEEMHGRDFAKKGGKFEMVQLWVNLPKKDKMTKPRYQGIQAEMIPEVELDGGAGQVRVIAGNYYGTVGPAKTFTPVNLWDIRLTGGQTVNFTVPEGHTASVFVLDGRVKLASGETLETAEISILERQGTEFSLRSEGSAKVLFLGGAVIPDPVVGYGPFVMNTGGEIKLAMLDYQSGKMGSIEPVTEGV
jgi:redox-sensitive bicupin YhaK (pirin superfamily)